MPPLLFEVGSGVLEMHSAVNSIRPLLGRTRFIEGEIEAIRSRKNQVMVRTSPEDCRPIAFDHLVVALGGVTNNGFIPGAAQHALTYKSLIDAVVLRNQIIALFETAAVESDAVRKAALLRFVVVGGGLVGTELMGELSGFVQHLAEAFPEIQREEICFDLIQSGERIIPEMDAALSEHAAKVLQQRGVNIHFKTRVERVEDKCVHLQSGERIDAATIIMATGVRATPIVEELPVPQERNGRLITDASLRVTEDTPECGLLAIAPPCQWQRAAFIRRWHSTLCDKRRFWQRTSPRH